MKRRSGQRKSRHRQRGAVRPEKVRDYAAEYDRRIKRALAKGLSRSQGRGHPGAGLQSLRRATKHDPKLEKAFKLFRVNHNLTGTAAALHVSRERLSNFIRQNELAERRGAKWIVTDRRPKPVVIYSKGHRKELVAAGLGQAQLAGTYWNDANKFLADPDPTLLEPYVGRSVVDITGVRHELETDPNGIYRAANEGGDPFEAIYKPTI